MRRYMLMVTEAELGLIDKALGDMPFRQVVTLLRSLQAQIEDQRKTKVEPLNGAEDDMDRASSPG